MKVLKHRMLWSTMCVLGLLAGWPGLEIRAEEALAQADGSTARTAVLQEAGAAQAAGFRGWVKMEQSWYWLNPDGTVFHGWLDDSGRRYYLGEDGVMAVGWKEIGGKWYYFHQDGGMNLGEMVLDNGVYQFAEDGSLLSSRWLENTGGGSYTAGCFDEEEQALFDSLSEEKREQYFDEYPDREEEYDGDMHTSYDRFAGFWVETALKEIASHRLEAAVEQGYADERIPGEGSLKDYLAAVPYRKNASCLELYIRNCEDADEAYDKVMERMEHRFDGKRDRKYSLEYYRYLGIAHMEKMENSSLW